MSSCDKPTTSPVVILMADLMSYIDGGEVQNYFKTKRIPTLSIIRFVSFVDGNLTIIVGGRFSGYRSDHLHNIYNAELA